MRIGDAQKELIGKGRHLEGVNIDEKLRSAVFR